MNAKSLTIPLLLMFLGVVFTGCGGGDTIAPVFSSATAADDLLDGNFTLSSVVYKATADHDVDVTYTLPSGIGSNDLFTIGSDGNVSFKTLPVIEGAYTDYNLTIRATDTAKNRADLNVTLRVMNDVIDLGATYGLLIAPVHVGGKWFYFWDRSGDGTSAEGGSLNGGTDLCTHDILDTLFNRDINGIPNTATVDYDGNFGTTNEYRYGTINGVRIAVPTTGTGLANEGSLWYSLSDNQTSYTDLAAIWDSCNSGKKTNGTPPGWQANVYWSATPNDYGHANLNLNGGTIYNTSFDYSSGYVALQVL